MEIYNTERHALKLEFFAERNEWQTPHIEGEKLADLMEKLHKSNPEYALTTFKHMLARGQNPKLGDNRSALSSAVASAIQCIKNPELQKEMNQIVANGIRHMSERQKWKSGHMDIAFSDATFQQRHGLSDAHMAAIKGDHHITQAFKAEATLLVGKLLGSAPKLDEI